MKVIIDKNGISGHVVNEKTEVAHKVGQKDTLSKRTDGTISNKKTRTVGDIPRANEIPKSGGGFEGNAGNIPRSVEMKARYSGGDMGNNSGNVPRPVERQTLFSCSDKLNGDTRHIPQMVERQTFGDVKTEKKRKCYAPYSEYGGAKKCGTFAARLSEIVFAEKPAACG